MMDILIDKLMHWILQDNKYDGDEEQIIRYGLELVILKVTFTIGALLIGAVMGCFIDCCVFLCAFVYLRSLAGGYHAKTRMLCALESSLLLIGCLLGIKLACVNRAIELIMYIVAVIAAIWVWKNGPVDCENKILENSEKIKIEKKLKVCLIAEIIACLLFAVTGVKPVSAGISFAVAATGILVLLEYFRR